MGEWHKYREDKEAQEKEGCKCASMRSEAGKVYCSAGSWNFETAVREMFGVRSILRFVSHLMLRRWDEGENRKKKDKGRKRRMTGPEKSESTM